MHHHMGHILAALIAGGMALLLSRCGVLPSGSETEPVDDVAPIVVETTTTTEPPATTTTTGAPPRSTTTAAVAPVLETDDPDEIAYCLATNLVRDVLSTGVRGEIDRVRSAINRRVLMMRSVTPPERIAVDLEVTLATAEAISDLLADDARTLDDKQDELAVLMTDETYRSSVASVAAFERDVCLID
jgi:hypothetical protein